MLTKQEIKDCLNGKCPSYVPAWLFWMDGKFSEENKADVDKMSKQYENDFVFTDARIRKRSKDESLESGEFTDDWGCLFRAAPDGVGSHPTRPIVTSVQDWERYVSEKMPEIDKKEFANGIRDAVENNQNRYILATFWRTFYERMFMLIGYNELMLEIGMGGELFTRMLSRLQDFTIRGIELVADAGADAIFLADDWGTQHRLMISPTAWVKYFKPAYARMIEVAHNRGLDVWFHSCGNIIETIPHWIDIGLDVISPLQTAAMDLPAVADTYHGQITFFGGIDVQYNLVKGAQESIRDEVQHLMKMFHADRGKYMFSPCNTIMPETPVENVWTLFEAIRKFGKYYSTCG